MEETSEADRVRNALHDDLTVSNADYGRLVEEAVAADDARALGAERDPAKRVETRTAPFYGMTPQERVARIIGLASRFTGLIPPGRKASEEIAMKIIAEADALLPHLGSESRACPTCGCIGGRLCVDYTEHVRDEKGRWVHA